MTSPKVVLVTGGNNGIGFEAVKSLLESDKTYRILVGSRSVDKANAAIDTLRKECPDSESTLEVVQVDLTSDESIERAFEQVKADVGYLDILINNAGAAFDPYFASGKISLRECYMKAYDVNVAGTNVLTWTFVPLLLKAAEPRLIFVTGLANATQASIKYFPTPPLPAGWPKKIPFDPIGYRCSKTALNMLMLDWDHKLKADGVKVWCVGPGMLITDLGGMREQSEAMGSQHASAGGRILRSVVEGERDADVGKIVLRDGLSAF